MWQNWQNKILREAAQYGYKSETAEFYEQELDEQVKTIQGVKFEPYKSVSLSGWKVFLPGGRLVGLVVKGTNTKTRTTPSQLKIRGADLDGGYDKSVLEYWPVNSGPVPNARAGVKQIIGAPAKMLETIAHWIIDNPNVVI